MQIKVTYPTGKRVVFVVEKSDKIQEVVLKIHVAANGNLPVTPHLVYNGRRLEEEKTLESYGVCDGSVLHITLREYVPYRAGKAWPEKTN
jgi:hypothetical protein